MNKSLIYCTFFILLAFTIYSCTNNKNNSPLNKDNSKKFPKIKLIVDSLSFKKLSAKREEALKNGMIIKSKDDWVKGKLYSENDTFNIKLRIKGDWIDHVKGDKWSFRIKIRGDKSWNRLRIFSIQNPKSRNFINEWVFHQLLDHVDVLTPRYDFINVTLNDQYLGIYAFEEHFVKQLLEFRGRREGPILKLNEDATFERTLKDNRSGSFTHNVFPLYESSGIEAFQISKILKDTSLKQQFEIATRLIQSYKKGDRKASEIFDIDYLARYVAIVDLTKAYHSIRWHNQRLYYNPISSLLEPIGYDAYADYGVLNWFGNKPFIGYCLNEKVRSYYGEQNLVNDLYHDKAFSEKYVFYLNKYTSLSFVNNFIDSVKKDVVLREAFIKQDYPNYKYDYNFIKQRAKNINTLLRPLSSGSVKAYKQKNNGSLTIIALINYHQLPIKVIGLGNKKGKIETHLSGTGDHIGAYNEQAKLEIYRLEFIKPGNILFYKVPGLDEIFTTKIYPWEIPEISTPKQAIFSASNFKSNNALLISNNIIRFRQGKHLIKSPVVIPKGYIVKVEPGTHINFLNGSYFLSRSPVIIEGTKENPIRIFSSDHTSMGFSVLNASEESTLRYTIFDGLSNLDINGWRLTGAVSFYKSNVNIYNSSFINNSSEDALNIINSNFVFENSLINHTSSDGFDADFCKGKVINSRVTNTINDGLDFSGSSITIENTVFINNGDKAISIGEESTADIKNINIDKAIIGIASKDLSNVIVNIAKITNCDTALATYQKKPEYGGAKITVSNLAQEKNGLLKSIAKNSSISISKENQN